ncbi:MAG: OmpA family protein [Saprospirales bacterium]|jgi:OOP family OmpA-OmpF porin|nr:OmpA family protein [Saprospirales bacterium]
MNSKALVLSVFALWSILCWYWYVCGIKQQCAERPPLARQAISFEPDRLLRDTPDSAGGAHSPAFTPIEDGDAGTTPPAGNTEPDLNKVKVEELDDHVLIHFPYNSTRKEDNDAIDAYLSKLARQLTAQGGTVALTGHTDNVGDSKTNYNFALRRAKNIRDILVTKGVKKNQITCKSSGETKPLSTNDTPRGRYKNRRVEIRVNP